MAFFETTHEDKNCRARTGIIHTDHGDIETPIFMPVGTQASVKTLDSSDLNTIGAQIILGNNYHLHLRPGENLIAEMGGLHKFMNWDKPILTDSGGFQVFSLGLQKNKKYVVIPTAKEESLSVSVNDGQRTLVEARDDKEQGRLVKIDEDGVTFKSHIDGSTHRFTPESAIECEHKIGADIIMAFDECTPDDAPAEYVREAMERTHRWAKRSLDQHVILSSRAKQSVVDCVPAGALAKEQRSLDVQTLRDSSTAVGMTNYKQFLFGIIQGAKNKTLREESAKYISSLDFDGIAIGGESIGYNMEATKEILSWVYPLIPANKPRYTMGVGLDPADLLEVVEQGIDMFDCVAPTRLARHGMLFVGPEENKKHRININNAKFAQDKNPVDKNCTCPICSARHSSEGSTADKHYSRAYLHHLFVAQEISAMRLASIHNLHFMLDLMRQAREAIKEDRFLELKKKWK